jgi:hypothetical protein
VAAAPKRAGTTGATNQPLRFRRVTPYDVAVVADEAETDVTARALASSDVTVQSVRADLRGSNAIERADEIISAGGPGAARQGMSPAG